MQAMDSVVELKKCRCLGRRIDVVEGAFIDIIRSTLRCIDQIAMNE